MLKRTIFLFACLGCLLIFACKSDVKNTANAAIETEIQVADSTAAVLDETQQALEEQLEATSKALETLDALGR